MSDLRPSKISIAFAIAKVALRTRRLRRNLMFSLTIAMMALVFLGAYPLAGFLSSHPWIFVFFWGFNFLIVITVMLLAIYDMLRVSKEERIDIEKIRRDFESQDKDGDE